MKKKLFRLRIDSNSFLNFTNFVILKHNDIFLCLKKITKLLDVLYLLKNSIIHNFKYLIDISAFDYVYYTKRFKVCYSFRSLFTFFCIFIYINIVLLGKLVSIYKLYKSSVWMEREVYDMFGLLFYNNFDLRRILNDYTFFGFPLRKDFPLTGYVELIYDIKKKRTFETLVELMQELRFYILSSPLELWDLKL